jgi:hypothetical protein
MPEVWTLRVLEFLEPTSLIGGNAGFIWGEFLTDPAGSVDEDADKAGNCDEPPIVGLYDGFLPSSGLVPDIVVGVYNYYDFN